MDHNELQADAFNEMKAWLATMSKRQELRENVAALSLEIEVLSRALFRAGARTPERVRALFCHMKEKVGMIYWPTAKDIEDARRAIVVVKSGTTDHTKGDRKKLSFDENMLLDEKILPAARRFLEIPSLRKHGEKTLEFWGEAVAKRNFGGAT